MIVIKMHIRWFELSQLKTAINCAQAIRNSILLTTNIIITDSRIQKFSPGGTKCGKVYNCKILCLLHLIHLLLSKMSILFYLFGRKQQLFIASYTWSISVEQDRIIEYVFLKIHMGMTHYANKEILMVHSQEITERKQTRWVCTFLR